jgi:hypothetical protein
MSLEATVETADVAAPLSIDRARMRRIAEDLVVVLQGSLSFESHLWIATYRPDALRCLEEAEQLLKDAWQKGDRKAFAYAVKFCSEKYAVAISICEKKARWLAYSGS